MWRLQHLCAETKDSRSSSGRTATSRMALSCTAHAMHLVELLVTSISQLLGDLFPSADERTIDIAVRITLVVIIFLILLTPIYIFFQ